MVLRCNASEPGQDLQDKCDLLIWLSPIPVQAQPVNPVNPVNPVQKSGALSGVADY
jgi:hypothetical protein